MTTLLALLLPLAGCAASRIAYDPDRVGIDAIAAAIADAGYQAHPVPPSSEVPA